jgi:tungstate transport system substrate-binding protein
MHNYFIVIGPKNDPAEINNSYNIKDIFKKTFKTKSYFVSRGDNSGTHIREKEIWKDIGLNPLVYSGEWYLQTGTNMGATINTAVGLNAYTFTDKATWIAFKNKLNYKIYTQNEFNLINEYSALVINNKKCPLTNEAYSLQIIKWLLSNKAKSLIEKFKKNNQQLFFIK